MNNNSKALILTLVNILSGIGIYTLIAVIITMQTAASNSVTFGEAWNDMGLGIIVMLVGIPVMVTVTLALMTYLAEAKFGLRHSFRNVLYANVLGLGAGIAVTCLSRGYLGFPASFLVYYLAYNTRLNAEPAIKKP